MYLNMCSNTLHIFPCHNYWESHTYANIKCSTLGYEPYSRIFFPTIFKKYFLLLFHIWRWILFYSPFGKNLFGTLHRSDESSLCAAVHCVAVQRIWYTVAGSNKYTGSPKHAFYNQFLSYCTQIMAIAQTWKFDM